MSKSTILIVEDEAIVAEDLACKLRQLGYEVAGIARGANEAVALASRLRPHLVLMDIRLEGSIDGIEAADAIQLKQDVPVIYLTAHSDDATLARAKLTGPFGYILKPFEERELATQIELALYKHQAESQLREQREVLRVTLTSIGDAVIATDGAGRITFMNPEAESLTGWKAEEALAQPHESVFRMINEQTGEALVDPVSRVLREGRALTLANHAALVTKDGRVLPIEDSAAPILDAAGKVIGAVLVFHDVSEKRRAEEALREAERKYRELIQYAPTAIFEVDFRKQKFTSVNQAMCYMIGYSEEELLAMNPFDLTDEEGQTRFRNRITKCLEGDVSNPSVELKVVAKDGSMFDVVLDMTLTFEEEGKPLGATVVGHDITERKRIEAELRRSRTELELHVQQRTAELNQRVGQLARLSSQLTLAEQRERRRLAVIIHDHLQQLIVGAKMRLEVLANRLGNDYQESFGPIYSLLVESLKTARSLSSQMAPHILYERGLASGLEWLAETMTDTYHIHIDTHIDPGIQVEPDDLKVLLFESARELLFNSVKHACTSSARINMARDETDNLRITISDHGVGFDSGKVMKELGRGDRFGLFTIRERLEFVAGRLEIESSPGNGATVGMIVPMDKIRAVTEPQETREASFAGTFPAPSPMELTIRVLLVDDHVVVRQGLLSLIEGHSDIKVVGEAADGEEAVQMARKLQPDVILMDISLPKMNGIEATRLIHSELPRTRIIGLSMYDDAAIKKGILNAGASAYMTKTTHTDDLLMEIRESTRGKAT